MTSEIPQVWADALTYAVRKNKGILKVSSYKNHIAPEYGYPQLENPRIHELYADMERSGYVAELHRAGGGIRMWQVTDRGREAVQ